MASEKLKILQMLEEGKINAGEAAKLLESLNGSDKAKNSYTVSTPPTMPSVPPVPPQASPYVPPLPSFDSSAGYSNNGPRAGASSGKSSEFKSDFDNFTNDLGKKFDSFVKDLEPKIQKFTDVVVEKTAVTADKISKTLASPPPATTASWSKTTYSQPVSKGRGLEKNIELKVMPGSNQLNISGLKGQVLLKGYNGDNISAIINYSPKSGAAAPELMVLGTKYFLSYDEDLFNFVSIDAFVPEFMFDSVNVSTIGGDLIISGIKSDFVQLDCIDGNMEIKDIDAKNLKIESNNGNIVLSKITAQNAQIEGFSGPIQGEYLDVSQLKMSTFNGPISMNIAYYSRFDDYLWNVEANNGRMLLNLPSMAGLGYHVKAAASLNNVKIGLTGLNYIKNDNSYIEAQSIDFDGCSKKVKMILETSNAPLTVN